MNFFNIFLLFGYLSVCYSIREHKCIPHNRCPNLNEVFSDCGPVDRCEASCQNPDLANIACPLICLQKCVCQEGFVRDDNWNCVKKDECRSKDNCPANEHYTPCGAFCEPSCKIPSLEMLICPAICREGCICDEGFVRSNGICIRAEACPKESDLNEEYRQCGSPCQSTCDNHNIKILCIKKCEPGCFCKEGFVRGPEGKCVDKLQCPQVVKKCGRGEIYNQCGSSCGDDTCETVDKPRICNKMCKAGCFCEPGKVRIDGREIACLRKIVLKQNKNSIKKHLEQMGLEPTSPR